MEFDAETMSWAAFWVFLAITGLCTSTMIYGIWRLHKAVKGIEDDRNCWRKRRKGA